jgi:hypothetical protein
MQRWHIIQGPDRLTVGPHDDLAVWSATIESHGVPARRRAIRVEFARTVLRSDRDLLIPDVREALDTKGQSAIERFLDKDEPPSRIIVSGTGILPPPD